MKALEKIKHWFIATELNGFRPHAFRHKWLSLYTLTLILSHYMTFGVAITGTLIKNPDTFSKEIIQYTNEERVSLGASALTENPELTKAAKAKLKDMLEKNYWDHIAPDGTEAWYFIENEGYKYTLAGENLAKGFSDPKHMVSAWMESPSHRTNLLKSDFTNIGIATANGVIDGQNTSVTVQLFGTEQATGNEKKFLTLGEQVQKQELSLENAFSTKNIPYLSLWFIIFVFMILDASMLKKLGLHKIKTHKYQMRLLLVLNLSLFVLLLTGFSFIA